tara:strand:+ start:674 stop:1141 length:468 start_codon:yes stop_codon:yes gene_type:complete
MNDEVKRGPGRPKAEQALKKGNSSWKPASVTDVANKEDGYRYRWSYKSPDNLAKKEAEGWETVSGLHADKVAPTDNNRIEHGKSLTSVNEKYDVVLQRIPEEMAKARDEYHGEKNKRRMDGLTAHLKKEMRDKGGNAPVHGEITISSRKGTQTFE